MPHILNNPVWQALSTRDSKFNRGTDKIKFFPETVSPFVGMNDWSEQGQTDLLNFGDGKRKWWVMKEAADARLDLRRRERGVADAERRVERPQRVVGVIGEGDLNRHVEPRAGGEGARRRPLYSARPSPAAEGRRVRRESRVVWGVEGGADSR